MMNPENDDGASEDTSSLATVVQRMCSNIVREQHDASLLASSPDSPIARSAANVLHQNLLRVFFFGADYRSATPARLSKLLEDLSGNSAPQLPLTVEQTRTWLSYFADIVRVVGPPSQLADSAVVILLNLLYTSDREALLEAQTVAGAIAETNQDFVVMLVQAFLKNPTTIISDCLIKASPAVILDILVDESDELGVFHLLMQLLTDDSFELHAFVVHPLFARILAALQQSDYIVNKISATLLIVMLLPRVHQSVGAQQHYERLFSGFDSLLSLNIPNRNFHAACKHCAMLLFRVLYGLFPQALLTHIQNSPIRHDFAEDIELLVKSSRLHPELVLGKVECSAKYLKWKPADFAFLCFQLECPSTVESESPSMPPWLCEGIPAPDTLATLLAAPVQPSPTGLEPPEQNMFASSPPKTPLEEESISINLSDGARHRDPVGAEIQQLHSEIAALRGGVLPDGPVDHLEMLLLKSQLLFERHANARYGEYLQSLHHKLEIAAQEEFDDTNDFDVEHEFYAKREAQFRAREQEWLKDREHLMAQINELKQTSFTPQHSSALLEIENLKQQLKEAHGKSHLLNARHLDTESRASIDKALRKEMDNITDQFVSWNDSASLILSTSERVHRSLHERDAELNMLSESMHSELRAREKRIHDATVTISEMTGRLAESERAAAEAELALARQKELFEETKIHFELELRAVEAKYQSIKGLNMALEAKLLDLHGKLEEIEATRLEEEAESRLSTTASENFTRNDS
eukprot:m.52198 g.52198  ORF g.52198 m.52198 type:complete len:754 (-) comp6675_c1_seq1:71-2332(-)